MAYTKFFSQFNPRVINYKTLLIPMGFYGFGGYLDFKDASSLTMFRDKSALFYRERKEGEEPSWPRWYNFWY